jgi:hypothetical protein
MKTIIAILLALGVGIAWADTTITYQGQLQDASGPYTGTPDMVFRLYDSLTGTNQIGTDIELQNVPVTDGLFQAELDFGDAYDGARWLEVVVDGNVLEPRQSLSPVPVAIRALNVSDGGGSQASWQLGGNAGTDPASDFLGTSDDTPFEIHAGNQRAMRIEPVDDADEGPNVIAGHDRNEATDGVVGATISGGGSGLSGLVDEKNTVGGDHATVGGGRVNTANGSGATIGGGVNNTTGGSNATVSGGINNEASGLASSVPGGDRNTATGDYSLAAGQQAKAEHNGAFVWADSIGADFVSSGSNQFLVRATGGAVISGGSSAVTDPGDARLYVDGTTRVRDLEFDSMAVSSGDALCITSSARVVVCGSTGRLKDDIEPLQNAAELVEQLRPVRYRWKSDGQYDVGLIAEEVAQVLPEIVRYGKSGEVETLQYSRVAAVLVGAFQELELAHGERLESLEVKSARLHEQVAELTKENRRLQQLTERNAKLEDRLATLEALLLEDRQVAGGQQ